MSEQLDPKGALVEKIAFAVLPILVTCVGYLMNSLASLGEQVTVLNSKMSLVVTSDNKQANNSGSELAREKLRQDLEKEIQLNRDQIQINKEHIAVMEERMKGFKR